MAFLGGGAAAGTTNNFTVISAASRVGIASLGLEFDTAPSSVTATLGGQALTPAGDSTSGGGTQTANYGFFITEAMFTAMGNGSKSLVFSVTGGVGVQGAVSKFSHFSGRSQDLPTQTEGGATSGTGSSILAEALANGADIIGDITHNVAAGPTTEGSGFTLIADVAGSGSDSRGAMEYKEAVTAGSLTVDFGLPDSTRWTMCAWVLEELNAAQEITGSGSLSAPAATLVGDGGRTTVGAGSLVAPTTLVGGVAVRGVLDTPGSIDLIFTGGYQLSGEGTVTHVGPQEITGTGALASPKAAVSGIGISNGSWIGAGELTAGAASLSAIAVRGVVGIGALTVAAPRVQGYDVDTEPGSGGILRSPLARTMPRVLKCPIKVAA